MTNNDFWDDFQHPTGDQWKPAEIGDAIVGTITSLTVSDNEYGKCPVIGVTTDADEARVVYASQYQLQSLLAEAKPNVGDRIAIAFTAIQPRPGGKTLKEFDVKVVPANATNGNGTAAPAPAQAPADTQAATTAAAPVSAADLI